MLTSYAGAGRAPGCDNNVISSRGTSRGKIEGAGVESFKFSAEVARCRDTDCKRYRLSKFGETVSRRSGGGVSEGNFHPFRPFLPGFHPRSRKLATAATSYRRDIRCIRTSFPLNLKSSLRRHSSGRSSNSTGNLTMPKVAPIKSAVSRIRLSDSIPANFSFYRAIYFKCEFNFKFSPSIG